MMLINIVFCVLNFYYAIVASQRGDLMMFSINYLIGLLLLFIILFGNDLKKKE